MEETVTSTISKAAALNEQNMLVLRDTADLESLKAQNPSLWFIVVTMDGNSVSHGDIQEIYVDLVRFVHLFDEADIRGSNADDEVATIERAKSAAGEIRILFGGVADKGSVVFALLAKVYPIYVSLLGVALPAIFLAVPNIVGSALRKISDVAANASRIDPRRHGDRLSVAGIPIEVAPLVIAFNGALDRLENEARKRQRFLIDAAHELRTPIAIMQTRIDGMPEGHERRRLLDDVARLGDTAEQLLDFERNDQAMDIDKPIDLVQIAHGVVAEVAPVAISAGYEISFHSDLQTLPRTGNEPALARAFTNLIRNAIDHGGGHGEIAISVTSTGLIRVSDEGPGIPAEHQELVFEPFYRVTPKSNGAGLGLSLVRQVVTNHGGSVLLDSGPNGTVVTISI